MNGINPFLHKKVWTFDKNVEKDKIGLTAAEDLKTMQNNSAHKKHMPPAGKVQVNKGNRSKSN